MPNLYLIAGCNGAGKTTASKTLFPQMLNCKEFVNADSIAAGISPYNPDGVALEAGRIMLKRVNHLLKEGLDFAFETTLSTRSFVPLLQRAREAGFRVVLIFLWLDSPAMAKARVAHRVSRGGHHIPDEIVERRYFRGISNLMNIYRSVCDQWMVFDNRYEQPVRIADGKAGFDANIVQPERWSVFVQQSNRVECPSAPYYTTYVERLLQAVADGVYLLVKERAILGDTLVVGDGYGGFEKMPAITLLEKLNSARAIQPSLHDTPAPY
jgi:predicted ABC-type ATPase